MDVEVTSSGGGSSGGGLATLDRAPQTRPFLEVVTTRKEARNWRGEKQPLGHSPEGLTPEIIEDNYQNTTNELNNLLNIFHDREHGGPAYLDNLLAQPDFHPFKAFYERFTEDKPGVDASGVPERHIKEAALREYLSTQPGALDAMELRIIKLEELAEQSGVIYDTNKGMPRQRAVERNKAMLDEGGPFYELARKAGYHITRNRLRGGSVRVFGVDTHIDTKGKVVMAAGGVTAALTAVGALGGPLGMIGGAALGAAGSGARYAFRSGENMTIEQSRNALIMAQSTDPAAAARRDFAKRMWGVTSDNVEWREREIRRGVLRAGIHLRRDLQQDMQLASPSIYFESMKEIIFAEAEALRDTQEALGIRGELRGMTNVGRRARNEQFRQSSSKFEAKVATEVKRQLFDDVGNPCQVFLPDSGPNGEWVDNTAQNATRYGADFATALAARATERAAAGLPAGFEEFDLQNTDTIRVASERRRIHRKLFTDRIHQNFDEAVENKNPRLARLRASLDAAERRTGGEAERTRIQGQITTMEGIRTDLGHERAAFDPINPNINALQTARDAAQAVRDRVAFMSGLAGGPTATAEQLLQDIIDDNTRPVVPGGTPAPHEIRIGHSRYTSIQGQRDAEQERHMTATGPGGGLTARQLREENEEHDKIVARIDAKEREVRAAIVAIENAETAVDAVYTTLLGNAENRRRLQAQTAGMEAARILVESWSTAAAGLTTADLQTEHVDALLQRINANYNPGPPQVGWQQNENANPLHRQTLLRAMAEARAIRHDTAIGFPPPLFDLAIHPAGFNFTETEVLTLSPAVLQRRSVVVGPPGLTDVEITTIKTIAEARYRARQVGIDEVNAQIGERIRELTAERAQVEHNHRGNPELATIRRLVDRYGAIRETITNMPPGQLITALDTLSTADPAVSREYTDYERDGTPPPSVAFISFQRWLGDYQNDTTQTNGTPIGREAAYRRNTQYLSQDMLRDQLVEWFDEMDVDPVVMATLTRPAIPATPATPAIPAADFDEVVDALSLELDAGRIRNYQFARFLTQRLIMNHFGPRVNAL